MYKFLKVKPVFLKVTICFAFFAALTLALTSGAHAQESANDGFGDMPPQAEQHMATTDPNELLSFVQAAPEITSPMEATHPPMRLTPDKSDILEFNRDVGRVIIGNDQHANLLMDSARRLLVVPRAPGATHFTILDNRGKVMMQRHVIVAGPEQQYIRVRRTCLEGGLCEETSVYYCPDMCHEIRLNLGEAAGGGNGAVVPGAADSLGGVAGSAANAAAALP
jgi:hypothetical protein